MTPDKLTEVVAWRYRHGPDDSWRVTQQRPECEQCESVPLVFQSDLAAAQARVKELEIGLRAIQLLTNDEGARKAAAEALTGDER